MFPDGLVGDAGPCRRLVLFPPESALGTPESRQRLILQEVERGEVGRQVTEPIEWSSSDPSVATVGRRAS